MWKYLINQIACELSVMGSQNKSCLVFYDFYNLFQDKTIFIFKISMR